MQNVPVPWETRSVSQKLPVPVFEYALWEEHIKQQLALRSDWMRSNVRATGTGNVIPALAGMAGRRAEDLADILFHPAAGFLFFLFDNEKTR